MWECRKRHTGSLKENMSEREMRIKQVTFNHTHIQHTFNTQTLNTKTFETHIQLTHTFPIRHPKTPTLLTRYIGVPQDDVWQPSPVDLLDLCDRESRNGGVLIKIAISVTEEGRGGEGCDAHTHTHMITYTTSPSLQNTHTNTHKHTHTPLQWHCCWRPIPQGG